MAAKREMKIQGCLPVLIVVAPWGVGMYVIVKATLNSVF